jgi:acyl-coenzyme A thioesterase PaaI-like protein
VIQSGKTLSVAEVAVEDDEGAAVARALVTYKIG